MSEAAANLLSLSERSSQKGAQRVKPLPDFGAKVELYLFSYLSAMSEAAANLLSLSERSSQKARSVRSHCQASAQRSNFTFFPISQQ